MSRIAFLTVTVCLLAACGGDTTSPAATNVVGTWTLSTYDGRALPVTVSQNALGTVEFTDDAFSMTADLKYVETGHLRTTPVTGAPTTTAQGDTGTYAETNGIVTFTSTAGNGADTGTIAGNKMTIIFQGHTLVYVRGS
jgi:hypothetical protein